MTVTVIHRLREKHQSICWNDAYRKTCVCTHNFLSAEFYLKACEHLEYKWYVHMSPPTLKMDQSMVNFPGGCRDSYTIYIFTFTHISPWDGVELSGSLGSLGSFLGH